MQVTFTIWIPLLSSAGGSSLPQRLGHLFCISSSSGPPAGGSQALKHPGPQIWVNPETFMLNNSTLKLICNPYKK